MTADHYGLRFLKEIKKDSQYGEYFSHEEYQALKEAATEEDFAAFLRSTDVADTRVYDDPAATYRDMKLVIEMRRIRSWWSQTEWYPGDPIGCAFLVVLAPVLLTMAFISSRRRLARLERLRERLGEETAGDTSPAG